MSMESYNIINETDYEKLPTYQKEFIANVLEQDFNVGNYLPIGASCIDDKYIKITADNNATNDINIKLRWDNVVNLKNDKLIILLNNQEWKFLKEPNVNLYKNNGNAINSNIETKWAVLEW